MPSSDDIQTRIPGSCKTVGVRFLLSNAVFFFWVQAKLAVSSAGTNLRQIEARMGFFLNKKYFKIQVLASVRTLDDFGLSVTKLFSINSLRESFSTIQTAVKKIQNSLSRKIGLDLCTHAWKIKTTALDTVSCLVFILFYLQETAWQYLRERNWMRGQEL